MNDEEYSKNQLMEELGRLRRRIAELEKRQTAELQALIDAIPAPVWFSDDPACRMITGNHAAGEILGLPPKQMNLSASAERSDLPTFEVWRGSECIDPSRMTMQTAVSTGKPVLGDELKIVRADGAVRWVYANAIPLLFPNGEVRGCVCVSMDITKLKETERALMESDATARTILNIPDIFAFLLDSEGVLLEAGETLAANFPYKISEMIQKSMWDLLPEDSARKRKAHFDTAVKSKRQVRFEDERQGVFYDNIITPILDDRGEVCKVAVLVFDITERKRSEKALRENQALLDQVLESSLDAVFAVDHDYRLLINNQHHRQALAASGGGPLPVGENILSLDYSSELRDLWRSAYDRALRGEEIKFETEWRDIDGTFRASENSISPLRSGGGSITGALAVVREITERYKAEAEIREKTEHLIETNAALKALLRQRAMDRKEFEESVTSNLKHLVLPYLESLKKSRLTDHQISWLDILEENLKQLTSGFAKKISLKELNLSNAELRVAALVRDGKSTKEIARILMTSEKTVSSHRDSIRNKLGLRGKKGGLRYLLMNLD